MMSRTTVPEPRTSLPVCNCKDDDAAVVYPKNKVERKSAKDRATQTGGEKRKLVRRNSDEAHHAIQLIQKSGGGALAPLRIPAGRLDGILGRGRMEPDLPAH